MTYEEKLAKLTPWAIVAFALRCVRRVQPLMSKSRKIHCREIDQALVTLEQCVKTRDWNLNHGNDFFETANNTITAVIKEARLVDDEAANAAAKAFGMVVRAAKLAIKSINNINNEEELWKQGVISKAVGAAGWAEQAAVWAVVAGRPVGVATRSENDEFAFSKIKPVVDNATTTTTDANWSDLDALEKLNFAASFDVTEFGPLGPLWPKDAPDWFRRFAYP